MLIGGLQKTTLIDYPGKVACTVFLIGCNFRCPFCYSAELVLPEKIKRQPRISEKDFFSFLQQRRKLLEGVVVCGGEPTINKDLPRFIAKIKKIGFSVKLDTNGSNPAMIEQLIGKKLLDYIAMDIKAPLEEGSYGRATGGRADLKKIIRSINIIKKSGLDYEFRTTVVPKIHTIEDILRIARSLNPGRAYFLQNFRPEKTLNQDFAKLKPYPIGLLRQISERSKDFFIICQVRSL